MPLSDSRQDARLLNVLDVDPGLAPVHDGEAARLHLRARSAWLARGVRELGSAPPEPNAGWLGLLIADGLVLRTIRVGGLECCELLGPGDLIRPWDREDELASLTPDVSWRVLQDTRVVLLDAAFARAAGNWPEVLAALMQRGLRRSRSLAVHLAIAQARRADARLLGLFWHLADRWGRVTQDGVLVELELTHGMLSRLTCLRRPTVSVTLRQLDESRSLVRLSRSTWLLPGTEPGSLDQLVGLAA